MVGPEYKEKELCTDAVISRRVRNGSGNIAKESAMSETECRKAMEAGRNVLRQMKELGYSIVSMGEMGIGNTTPTAVLAGLLMKLDAPEVTGRGAGLSNDGLDRKIRTVQKAMDRIRALGDISPETVLREGGCLEIAAMTGLLLEAAPSLWLPPGWRYGWIPGAAGSLSRRTIPRNLRDIELWKNWIFRQQSGETFRWEKGPGQCCSYRCWRQFRKFMNPWDPLRRSM